jgi:hypothetical protein
MINNNTVLITRPDDDSTLNFLYFWTEKVVEVAQKRGYKLLDLKGNKSSRKNLESYINKNGPSLVLFNGHGTKNSICGYNNEPIIELSVNDYFLSGRIVYARSCASAAELGIKCNARVFIGYDWDFVFYYDPRNISHPTKDKLAERFLGPSNLIGTTLLKGKTANEANNRSKSLMLKNYFEMVSSKGSYEEQKVASFLWGNISGQRIYGDPEAHV